MKLNELIQGVPKGSQKRTKLPQATDKPEKYIGKWETYSIPQGVNSKKKVEETIRRPVIGILNCDYEIVNKGQVMGVARVDDSVITILGVNDELSEDFNGQIFSKALHEIVKDADRIYANLSIRLAENTMLMKRFLERYGFRHVGDNVFQRRHGSVSPPSVML